MKCLLVIFACFGQLAFGYETKQLTLINKCNKEIRVSVASWVQSIGRFYWAVEGWIDIEAGDTKTRRVSASRNPYVRAQLINQDSLTSSDGSFCVSKKAYSARQYQEGNNRYLMGVGGIQSKADSCSDVGGYSAGFQRLDFENKYTNINFTIRCPR